jgi:hypothetical protein
VSCECCEAAKELEAEVEKFRIMAKLALKREARLRACIDTIERRVAAILASSIEYAPVLRVIASERSRAEDKL